MVWYSHLFQNFLQFIVIHTVKGFGIVNKAEIDVFLELSCFFHDPADVGNLIFGSSAFAKTSLNFQMFKLVLENAEEQETKFPTSIGSLKKQDSSRKTSTSALLTMLKSLTVWITTNCGKFFKRLICKLPDNCTHLTR